MTNGWTATMNKGYFITNCFDDAEQCKRYAERMLILEKTPNVFADPTFGGAKSAYRLYDDLLELKIPHVEELVGKRLYPTYSYSRIYRNGHYMEPHKDRDACEYSVSITMGYGNVGKPYPICFGTEELHLDINEMVVYKGRDVVHWRDVWDCPDDAWQVQIFLHYVDQDGPFASERNDVTRREEAEKLFGKNS